jgi:hypothetical protein
MKLGHEDYLPGAEAVLIADEREQPSEDVQVDYGEHNNREKQQRQVMGRL